VPIWLKYGLLAVVIAAILYVLISPLPEPDAVGSIKSNWLSFAIVLSWALFLAFSVFSLPLASLPLSFFVDDILKKNCSRLC
jgi:ABC-type Fe3+-siderophore transport system permease subunit